MEDENYSTDFNNFAIMMNIAKTAKQENEVCEFLDESEIINLEQIFDSKRPLTSAIALALLKQNNPEYIYSEDILDIEEPYPSMAPPSNENNSPEGSEIFDFEIYPNPTYDYITLRYNQESKGEIIYNITDGSGKLVLQKQLEISEYPEQTEVLIDLQSLNPGVYYFNLFNNSKSEGIRKLIVLK